MHIPQVNGVRIFMYKFKVRYVEQPFFVTLFPARVQSKPFGNLVMELYISSNPTITIPSRSTRRLALSLA